MTAHFRISRGTAVKQLMERYGFTEERAKRVCDIANEFGRKAEPCDGGFVHVVSKGFSQSWPYTALFTIYDHSGKDSTEKVAHRGGMDYTSPNATKPIDNKKGTTMPPRGRKAATVEPEETEDVEAGPYDRHLTKDLSPTQSDYADWYHENVADINDMGKQDPARLLVHGLTLYKEFQQSDFNKNQREQRRTARGADNGEVEAAAEAPAKPARGRPAAAKPAAAPAKPAPAKPGPPRRGRAAAAAESAPY